MHSANLAEPSYPGSELLVRALREQGVSHLFGYPGGAIMPVYDALADSGLIHILTRHEQGAALAANGYARASGRVGVCLATSGPGATNLITGIADTFLDSIPMVAITGQVEQNMMGTDAFQEVDTFGITLPLVKHSYILRHSEDIPAVVSEAFALAAGGRPGPVLIDLPKDVSVARAPYTTPHAIPCESEPLPDAADLARADALLKAARKPLLYVGGGIRAAGAETALRQWMETSGVPAVSSLQGLGAVPSNHPAFLGMLGMHGNQSANLAVQQCDLLIAAGVRFDDRATGKLAGFAPKARIIHLDVDPAEVSKLRRVDLALIGDLKHTLATLPHHSGEIRRWQRRCAQRVARYRWRYDAPGQGIYAPSLLKRLTELGGERMIITSDVGQHQMWVAQHCRFHQPRAHISSGGLGTMGFGLPAGIGAKLARPDHCVVTVSGDGSIMMNIQELATLRRYAIDLKIIVLDNTSLGLVRQWQELFYAGNYSEVDLSDNPDFAALARCFGLQALSISQRDEVDAALSLLLASRGPTLLHVRIDPKENVWPLVPPGCSNEQMINATPTEAQP